MPKLCRFAALKEHRESECPICNPDNWKAPIK
jgi:hypothetical protein